MPAAPSNAIIASSRSPLPVVASTLPAPNFGCDTRSPPLTSVTAPPAASSCFISAGATLPGSIRLPYGSLNRLTGSSSSLGMSLMNLESSLGMVLPKTWRDSAEVSHRRSIALVMPTYSKRRSSSMPPGSGIEDLCGSKPSSKPTTKTFSNSRPLALCIVIIVTASGGVSLLLCLLRRSSTLLKSALSSRNSWIVPWFSLSQSAAALTNSLIFSSRCSVSCFSVFISLLSISR